MNEVHNAPILPPGLGEIEDVDPFPLGAAVPPADFTVPLPWPNDRISSLLDEAVILPDGRVIPEGQLVYQRVEAALSAHWHHDNFWVYLVKIAGAAQRLTRDPTKPNDQLTCWIHEHTRGTPNSRPIWERILDVDAPAGPT